MKMHRIVSIGLTFILLLLVLPIAWIALFTTLKCPRTSTVIPVQEYTSEIDDLTVHYRIAGNPKKQPIVFLHGWAARKDGACGNDKVIEALAEHFYVIAPEHPGFIRSEPPKIPWTFEEYVKALRELLLPLKLSNPILMAQSWGGGIASMYAKLYPDDIKALVLIDARLSDRRENWYAKLRYAFNDFYVWIVESRFIPFPLKKLFVVMSQGAPSEIVTKENISDYAVMGDILPYSYNFQVDYAALPMPILLIWGDRDTWVSDMEKAKKVAVEAKNGKFLTVSGSHTVLYQRPKEVVDLMVSSLKEL